MLTERQQRHRTYLQSPQWQARRNRFRRTAGGCCIVCGSQRVDVHHLDYRHSGSGDEPDYDLMLLCRPHHDLAHMFDRSTRFASLRDATIAMVLACGPVPPPPLRHRRRERLVPIVVVATVLAALVLLWLMHAVGLVDLWAWTAVLDGQQ